MNNRNNINMNPGGNEVSGPYQYSKSTLSNSAYHKPINSFSSDK